VEALKGSTDNQLFNARVKNAVDRLVCKQMQETRDANVRNDVDTE
jgi:hypothetical protein